MEILSVYDLLLTPLYLVIIILLAVVYQKHKVRNQPEYKYFTIGLTVKIIGAIALGLVYNFYYSGGDTINYYQTAHAYSGLLAKNTGNFFWGWLGNPGLNSYLFFDDFLDYPVYWHRDPHSFFVVRLEIPIVILGCRTYFPSALLTAVICYSGSWKLFQVFCKEFPHLKKQLAIATIFIPSVIFWGSGIMKDSFTLSAVGWYTYSFYNFFIQKRYRARFIIQILVASFFIISIKPYIFFAILPGSIIWLSNQQISKIKNKTFRFFAGPVLLSLGGLLAFAALNYMGDYLGMYKVDSVLDRAVVVQKDMKADYYGGNAFDIGEFDASIGGVSAKAPIAIASGLFRPSLLDVKNPMMLVSALENTYLLILTLFLLIKLRIKGFFSSIGNNPIVLFSLIFSIFFAFSVGLSVANFGSLVRLRIPELPFFVASLYILRDIYEKKSGTIVRF
ncbi:MAG: hypothetical protein ACJ76F_11215 [Bacteroidia bacterium]